MSKKNYEVKWTPNITVTAGSGSISVSETKTGGTDTATTKIYPYTDNFKTVTEPITTIRVTRDDNNNTNVSYSTICGYKFTEALRILDEHRFGLYIPIEWIKKYLHELVIISKDNLDLGEDGYFDEVVAIENMLSVWWKENDENAVGR